jgi:hypothetical protein
MNRATVLIVSIVILLSGCMTPLAHYSGFPESAQEIEYENLPAVNTYRSPFWTTQSLNEYYLELPHLEDSILAHSIAKALRRHGYKIRLVDIENRKVLAERGLRVNE